MNTHPVQLIVGLGNPGTEYAATRHNVGAWLVEMLVRQHNLTLASQTKFKSLVGQLKQGEYTCGLLIPTTYMNLSGHAVQAFVSFYKIAPENILVVHDELDFPPGVIKLKQGGGHGGHNGLRDIVQQLGSNNFQRLRIGIGHPGHRDAVSDYVLHKPSVHERTLIIESLERGISVIPALLAGELQKAMRDLHSDCEWDQA